MSSIYRKAPLERFLINLRPTITGRIVEVRHKITFCHSRMHNFALRPAKAGDTVMTFQQRQCPQNLRQYNHQQQHLLQQQRELESTPQTGPSLSEAEFHQIADTSLEIIEERVEEAFERFCGNQDDIDFPRIEYEISLASGVLTLDLPPHGTWVLNKQTPNAQIWWSSPLSGPKRFEFIDQLWCNTQDGMTLGSLLVQELLHVYPQLSFQLDV